MRQLWLYDRALVVKHQQRRGPTCHCCQKYGHSQKKCGEHMKESMNLVIFKRRANIIQTRPRQRKSSSDSDTCQTACALWTGNAPLLTNWFWTSEQPVTFATMRDRLLSCTILRIRMLLLSGMDEALMQSGVIFCHWRWSYPMEHCRNVGIITCCWFQICRATCWVCRKLWKLGKQSNLAMMSLASGIIEENNALQPAGSQVYNIIWFVNFGSAKLTQ